MDDATSICDVTTADTGGPGSGFIGVLSVLEALKQASHDLHSNPSRQSSHSDSALKALLELETESDTILSKDPNLSALSHHLSSLKTVVATLRSSSGYGLSSFLTRRVSTHSISRAAESIESELQAWIDRETVNKLVELFRRKPNGEEKEDDEDDLMSLLSQLESRVARGFDRDLQDLILKSKLFTWLQSSLCDAGRPNRIREQVGFAIAALIRFNKDVFVGQVGMKETIRALIGMSSGHSLKVLCSLIRSIKSPFVDEIESNGEIPKIINLLNSENLQLKVVAMDCVLEIGYFGRKEAVEAMINGGLIRKLVDLQRSELGGDLIDLGRFEQEQSNERSSNGDAEDNDGLHHHHNHHHRRQQSNGGSSSGSKRRSRERRYLESHPFASCVARFAVQLEVGEGLRQREKRALKQEIIGRVREACDSDAETATIVAEVLWGSSP